MSGLTGKKILVVDDEREMCSLMADEFQFAKASVEVAYSGREAVGKLQNQSFDVVVSDMRMPDGDGLFLLREIRKPGGIPCTFILLTGFSECAVSELYDIGADSVFHKPVDLDRVIAGIGRLLLPIDSRLKTGGGWISENKRPPTAIKRDGLGAAWLSSAKFGRSGMFLPDEAPALHLDQETDFSFSFQSPTEGLSCFSGKGICRWVRKAPDSEGPAGMGIEFISLSEESLAFLLKVLASKPTLAYIPKS